jgi:hypothetical protein
MRLVIHPGEVFQLLLAALVDRSYRYGISSKRRRTVFSTTGPRALAGALS